jgi:murein DD-endopeptidase MepM/ murein hydrolase activator NlpD
MRKSLLVLPLLLLVGVVALGILRIGPAPAISIKSSLPGIGRRTPIAITVNEPTRGLAGVRVELIQNGETRLLAEEAQTPRGPLRFWGPAVTTFERTIEVGKETVEGLRGGEATIRVTANRAPSWLQQEPPAAAEVTLPVRLAPPSLAVLSTQTYVKQGGCEAVVYRVGEGASRDGVVAGDWFFPGFPLPGSTTGERFALFAAPYDHTDASAIRLVADDGLGNEARLSFVDQFTPRPLTTDDIEISDAFLAKVVPEIQSQTPELPDRGSPLATYLEINRNLRQANNQVLRELAAKSEGSFLWRGVFLPLPNGKVMSSFADRRSYVYNSEKVDQQDHLGFDLASTAHAPVPAAGAGVVVLARYFGIYGNAVVIDHGYGLASLYGHLSTIAVSEGQRVDRGTPIGNTGATGLAGGDHLHFTMLLDGLAVSPVEWWDQGWITNRLGRKLGAAMPTTDGN